MADSHAANFRTRKKRSRQIAGIKIRLFDYVHSEKVQLYFHPGLSPLAEKAPAGLRIVREDVTSAPPPLPADAPPPSYQTTPPRRAAGQTPILSIFPPTRL